MLCCDDTERENGNEEKAQKMFDLCEEFDWISISMKKSLENNLWRWCDLY